VKNRLNILDMLKKGKKGAGQEHKAINSYNK
jgi:hypothetical protein